VTGKPPIRIANCSGFYGDRFAAPRELLEGGPLDILTGDYLAELTMLILWKARQRDGSLGYATTFYRQMEEVLATCAERGTKVVSNAGGLNPAGLAERLRRLAHELGIEVRVAHVEGDDVLDRLRRLLDGGEPLTHLDTGEPLASFGRDPVSANVYLGGFSIAEALSGGADVVVTGRVTDASLVAGPAAWHFGWGPEDLDELAGAVVAGHVLECGTQATGGNYSFFGEVPGLEHPGFPVAEVCEDGSALITKQGGTGGRVSVGTVTAQLLYEIAGPLYANPDVTADFSSTRLEQVHEDGVRLSGTKGHPPPEKLKVSLNLLGGWRNTTTFVLTGLEIEHKAELVTRTLAQMLGSERGLDVFDDHDVRLLRTDRPDASTNEQASAQLRITVKDADPEKVGRRFSSAAIELALASYPGFYVMSAPTDASAYGVYWPVLVPRDLVEEVVVHDDGRREPLRSAPRNWPANPVEPVASGSSAHSGGRGDTDWGPTERVPLGSVAGARSGDKGPNANVGFWVTTDVAFEWLREALTVDRLRDLLEEARPLAIDRYELANLRAVNFVIHGLLGEGVASSTRPDAQAKSLGEYLRSRLIDVPSSLLTPG
jgi:Acyclic terpene utilisation family protein AtuA